MQIFIHFFMIDIQNLLIGLCFLFLFVWCFPLTILILFFFIIFQDFNNILLLIITNDNINTFRDIIFLSLYIAAAGNNNRIRVHLSCFMKHLSGLPVRHIRDGTGINDIDIRTFLKRHDLISMLFQQFLHGFRLICIYFASEIMQCYFLHISVPFFLKRYFNTLL